MDLTTLAKHGKLKTGKDYVFNLKNGGVGLGSVSPKIPKAYVAKTTAIGEADRERQDQGQAAASSSRASNGSRGWVAAHPRRIARDG